MQPFAINEALFLNSVLQNAFWGVYTTIFIIYLLLGGYKRTHNLRFPLIALWIVCTAFNATEIVTTYTAVFGTSAREKANVGTKFNWMNSTLYSFADYISQSILIYRCWVMWNRRWVVVILPMLSSLTALLAGFILVFYRAARPDLPRADLPGWFFPFGTGCFALSLATNTLVTGALVVRLWLIRRETADNRMSGSGIDIRPIITILTESGMLTFVGQLIWVVMFGLQHPAFNAVVGGVTQIYGLTPTLVIVRVTMGRSYETEKTRMKSTMVFAAGPGGTTRGTDTTHGPGLATVFQSHTDFGTQGKEKSMGGGSSVELETASHVMRGDA